MKNIGSSSSLACGTGLFGIAITNSDSKAGEDGEESDSKAGEDGENGCHVDPQVSGPRYTG